VDDRIRALLVRLGSTERVARELIEIGTPALEAVDAFVADVSQRKEVRLLASRVAHEIRARDMRAPPAPPDPTPPLGDGFWSRHQLPAFLDQLGDAVIEHDTIVVTLSDAPEERARIFAIYDAEAAALGEGFGGEDELDVRDTGQRQLRFWWD